MKNKYNLYNSIPIEKIIENNLSIQSIQRTLLKDFGIKNATYSNIINSNFIKNYFRWDQEKKNKFIKIIGGVVYFSKIKKFLDTIENESLNKNI